MSILIKIRNMPDSCLECFCLNDEYLYCQAVGRKPSDDNLTNTRPDWCPLVPVPPHGRLIDADALDDAFTDLRWENGDYKSGALMHWGDRPHWCLVGGEVENLINAAPTIIPAEEDET